MTEDELIRKVAIPKAQIEAGIGCVLEFFIRINP
jgi:hypothetical protein